LKPNWGGGVDLRKVHTHSIFKGIFVEKGKQLKEKNDRQPVKFLNRLIYKKRSKNMKQLTAELSK
jgi:hypothetical protein